MGSGGTRRYAVPELHVAVIPQILCQAISRAERLDLFNGWFAVQFARCSMASFVPVKEAAIDAIREDWESLEGKVAMLLADSFLDLFQRNCRSFSYDQIGKKLVRECH